MSNNILISQDGNLFIREKTLNYNIVEGDLLVV